MRKHTGMFLTGIAFFFTSCSSIQQGPSDSLIKQDVASLSKQCLDKYFQGSGDLLVDDVKVVGKSTEANDATVLVDIRSHFTGTRGNITTLPPCSLFSIHKKEVIHGQLKYKKYDTGWRFDAVERGFDNSE